MDKNSAAANELRSAAETISLAAVAKDYARRPELLARYGERGRAMYLQDTRFHLSYLADAIGFGRPSIFRDYLGWVADVLAARGVAPEELNENLRCVREVLDETRSPESLAIALEAFDAGVAAARAAAAGAPQSSAPLPADGLAKRYLDFLLRGERQQALELMQDALRSGTGIREIWLHVF
jgi:MerR family transcriptional regulator, light-induced transcriptional regulator